MRIRKRAISKQFRDPMSRVSMWVPNTDLTSTKSFLLNLPSAIALITFLGQTKRAPGVIVDVLLFFPFCTSFFRGNLGKFFGKVLNVGDFSSPNRIARNKIRGNPGITYPKDRSVLSFP